MVFITWHPRELLPLPQAVTAVTFTSLDEASQKEYLLHSSRRSTIVAQQDAAVYTLAGAAAAMAEWPTRRRFAVLHYRLTQDGCLLPCLPDVPPLAAPLTPDAASAATMPAMPVADVTRCKDAEHEVCKTAIASLPYSTVHARSASLTRSIPYTEWSRAAQRSCVSAARRALAAPTQRGVRLAGCQVPDGHMGIGQQVMHIMMIAAEADSGPCRAVADPAY